jgi:hypothetical protein
LYYEKKIKELTMIRFEVKHTCSMLYQYGNPGRKLRAGSGRKAPEIAGTWKQYSHRKIFGFFPMISDRFLPESTGNRQESTGKNPINFQSEYCFHFRRFPGLSCRIRRRSRFFPAGFCGIQWP